MQTVDYPLKNGGFVRIDKADLPLIDDRQWSLVRAGKKAYAASDKNFSGKTVRTYMHRLLMGVCDKSFPLVDHIDGDGLNNSRSNLRLASHGMNTQNTPSKNRYRGVFKQSGGFVARAGNSYAGIHKSPLAAAIAYDELVTRVYGPDARVNFPKEIGTSWITNRFLCVL